MSAVFTLGIGFSNAWKKVWAKGTFASVTSSKPITEGLKLINKMSLLPHVGSLTTCMAN